MKSVEKFLIRRDLDFGMIEALSALLNLLRVTSGGDSNTVTNKNKDIPSYREFHGHYDMMCDFFSWRYPFRSSVIACRSRFDYPSPPQNELESQLVDRLGQHRLGEALGQPFLPPR